MHFKTYVLHYAIWQRSHSSHAKRNQRTTRKEFRPKNNNQWRQMIRIGPTWLADADGSKASTQEVIMTLDDDDNTAMVASLKSWITTPGPRGEIMQNGTCATGKHTVNSRVNSMWPKLWVFEFTNRFEFQLLRNIALLCTYVLHIYIILWRYREFCPFDLKNRKSNAMDHMDLSTTSASAKI